jgi:hypothetical protein
LPRQSHPPRLGRGPFVPLSQWRFLSAVHAAVDHRRAKAGFWPSEAGRAARIGPYRDAPSAIVLIGARPAYALPKIYPALGRAFSFRPAKSSPQTCHRRQIKGLPARRAALATGAPATNIAPWMPTRNSMQARVAFDQPRPHLDRAAHGVHHAAELDDAAVAGRRRCPALTSLIPCSSSPAYCSKCRDAGATGHRDLWSKQQGTLPLPAARS